MNRFLIKKPTSPAKEHKQFVLSFILVIAFGFGLTRWVNATYQENYNAGAGNIDETIGSVKGAYINILSESDKSADTLLFEGINLINKNQLELGLMSMEKSVEKDPNWRDSALYTGYEFLMQNSKCKIQNDNLKIKNDSECDQLLQSAKFYLEKARDIDPLYAKTHQYLAIVYQKLGDTQNAELSTQRAQDFAK